MISIVLIMKSTYTYVVFVALMNLKFLNCNNKDDYSRLEVSPADREAREDLDNFIKELIMQNSPGMAAGYPPAGLWVDEILRLADVSGQWVNSLIR